MLAGCVFAPKPGKRLRLVSNLRVSSFQNVMLTNYYSRCFIRKTAVLSKVHYLKLSGVYNNVKK